MIDKVRFKKINKGDVLLVDNQWRKVVRVNTWTRNSRAITFKKLDKSGDTVYLYSDLKHKIRAIVKIK